MEKPTFNRTRLLLVTALLLGSIATSSAEHGGRLIIWRIPGLGDNLFVGVDIDGRHAGDMPYGHHFETVLSPGRHVITVQPYPRIFSDAGATVVIKVRPGGLYNFTIKGSVRQLFLSGS